MDRKIFSFFIISLTVMIVITSVWPYSLVFVMSTSNQSLSIADELQKLIKMKKEGILTEQEFNQMKQKLLN